MSNFSADGILSATLADSLLSLSVGGFLSASFSGQSISSSALSVNGFLSGFITSGTTINSLYFTNQGVLTASFVSPRLNTCPKYQYINPAKLTFKNPSDSGYAEFVIDRRELTGVGIVSKRDTEFDTKDEYNYLGYSIQTGKQATSSKRIIEIELYLSIKRYSEYLTFWKNHNTAIVQKDPQGFVYLDDYWNPITEPVKTRPFAPGTSLINVSNGSGATYYPRYRVILSPFASDQYKIEGHHCNGPGFSFSIQAIELDAEENIPAPVLSSVNEGFLSYYSDLSRLTPSVGTDFTETTIMVSEP